MAVQVNQGQFNPVPVGKTPQELAGAEERAEADVLAGKLCAAAAMAARSESQLLELIGEFDAIGAVRWWSGVKSLAHWLSWTCSMTSGVAREHVRVARALRRMPTVREAFAHGQLSYSKVREVTRVVDVIDEARLCQLALTATAAQLAKMISGFRTADGLRIQQQAKRAVTWQTRDDGMVQISARLPAEEAAVVIAAVTAAKDQFGAPPASPDPTATGSAETATDPVYGTADALLDVARVFLDTTPQDRSGEDRTLVVVHVSSDLVARSPDESPDENAPAGTPAALGLVAENVPAGTLSAPLDIVDATCHVAGVAPIERETARRIACDADLLGAVVDRHGDVLALGRTQRLVSRAQRRALMIRDRMCRFPGCAQIRHLKAHHRIAWADGGPTDLENLILLCQFHHTAVHEGGMTIQRGTNPGEPDVFRMPDGTPHQDWYTADQLPQTLVNQLDRQRDQQAAQLSAVTGFAHPAAQTIRPGWAGEPFDRHACVEALFAMRLPDQEQAAA